MLENRLDQLKQNWPLITAIIMLIVSGVAYLIFPYDNFATRYRPTPGEVVDYWAFVRHSVIITLVLFMPFALVILPSVIIIWQARRHTLMTNLASLLLLSLSFVFALILGIGIVVTIIFTDGTRVNHLSTTNFDGRNYHLAIGYTTAGGGDVFFSRYLVYECEPESELCHLIHDNKNLCSYTSDCKPEASLIMIDKTLLLEVEDERAILVSN